MFEELSTPELRSPSRVDDHVASTDRLYPVPGSLCPYRAVEVTSSTNPLYSYCAVVNNLTDTQLPSPLLIMSRCTFILNPPSDIHFYRVSQNYTSTTSRKVRLPWFLVSPPLLSPSSSTLTDSPTFDTDPTRPVGEDTKPSLKSGIRFSLRFDR